MNEFVFPCSPNWFLSSVSSGNEAGLYAFGAKNHVYVYDVSLIVAETGQSQLFGEDESGNVSHKVPRLISRYEDHEQKVSAVCLSPDPEQMLCCSADEAVVSVWDILTRTTIQSHYEHKDKITCMTWAPCDRNLVISASEKGTVVLWRLRNNAITSFQPQRDYICCMKASPHSAALVALGYRSGVTLIMNIGYEQPQILQKLRGLDSEITSICWCPVEGDYMLDVAAGQPGTLIAAAAGKLIKIWSSTTGKEVFYKKVQQVSGYRVSPQDPSGKKQWLDILWPKESPDYIISSSPAPQGDLLLWNLNTKSQQEPELFDISNINKHLRVIFNIVFVGDRICTFSLDRIVAVWDLKSRKGLVSWSSFGGYPYCIRASPIDPGMVAIGAGDNTVRIWNQNSKSRPFDITSLCYGVRSMITSVAWHPDREGLLAFGTDDGRVGVINTLIIKPPSMSAAFHKRTVYVVSWGPPVHAEKDSHHYHVYSVGDGIILQHFIGESSGKKEAVNLIDAIHAVSGSESDRVVRSEIVWKKDYTSFAIGCDNGSVVVYNFPGLREIFVINIHHKMINCVRWHPEMTLESIHNSPCRNWLALAGNDRHISIVDLPSLFVGPDASILSTVTITEAFCQLPGHLGKTTDLCWSPHHDGRLVSVGYDRTAVVWNVKSGESLARYSGHNERLLSVMWSYLDSDLIMTGGCDSSLRLWRVSSQSNTAVDVKERKWKKRKVNSNTPSLFRGDTAAKETVMAASEQEIQELQDLLVAKQQELLSQLKMGSDSTEKHSSDGSDSHFASTGDNNDTDGLSLRTTLKDSIYRPPQQRASATTTTTPSTTIPPDNSSGVAPTGLGAPTSHPPSSLIGSSRSAQDSSPASGDQSLSAVENLATTTTNVVVVGVDREDGRSIHIGDNHAVCSPPLVTELVAPVRPLFPKPGFDTTISKSSLGPLLTTDTDTVDKSRRRKLKQKSLFPVSSSANNKGKAAVHQDIVDLSRIKAGQGCADLVDSKPHLGLYTDRLGAHRCLLQESEFHLSHDNMEYHLQLELWRGNVAGAIQIARQRNELSDWIVSMAPLASHDLWELVSAEYAEQLEEDGQYHKAATYLLAAHKVQQAIDLFRRHKLFKEAVSLARIRLTPADPIFEDIYADWGQNLMKEGQFEQAAKCYLAMRHIQEAANALTRRHDQSSLKTACHVTLLSNEKQQGLTLAYKLFNQYLVMGEWQEAYQFVSEHDSLKTLLPILSVHEHLIQHLTALCPSMTLTQKQVTPDMFSHLEKKEDNRKATELPEFLLDKSEMDPVVPWEPFLIGERTFPHHILKVWHQHLNITMVTQELKSMHAAISQLVPHRHAMGDLPNLLVQTCIDITLCLLALLTSETSNAIVHLLVAMSTVHQSNHTSLQQALCRLMLPQGPRYLLKLQQEFNASRVLITMESHGDMDKAGGFGLNSIKKFMTDIKDDSAISVSSVRCRELDCLRAYCYLAILDYLRETLPYSHSENDSLDGMPNGKSAANQNIAVSNVNRRDSLTNDKTKSGVEVHSVECSSEQLETSSSPAISKLNNTVSKEDGLKMIFDQNRRDLDQNGSCNHDHPALGKSSMGLEDDSQFVSDPRHKECDRRSSSENSTCRLDVVLDTCHVKPLAQELASSPSSSTSPQPLPNLSNGSPESSSVDCPVPSNPSLLKTLTLKLAANTTNQADAKSLSHSHNCSSSPKKTAADSSKTSPGGLQQISPEGTSSSPSKKKLVKCHLNYLSLLRLSKGILWDIQAKREALTKTLGYVHQAISQHLLINRSANGNSHSDQDLNPSVSLTNSKHFQQTPNSDTEEDGSCHRTRLLSASSPHKSEVVSHSEEPETAPDPLTKHTTNIIIENSTTATSLNLSNIINDSSITSSAPKALDRARSVSPEPTLPPGKVSQQSPVRTLSDNYSPHKSTLSLSSMLDHSLVHHVDHEQLGSVSNDPVPFQTPHKVLWVDGRETSGDALSNSQPSSQITRLAPDGSSIPLEWDSLPVDMKYSIPSISLSLLRQEQESISQELKKVPEVSKISFPPTTSCVRNLLQTTLRSPDLAQSEKSLYLKQLKDWATVFAVTSHEQQEVDSMFAAEMTASQ